MELLKNEKCIHFELTWRCNYHCEYCVENNWRIEKGTDNLDASDEVVDGFLSFVSALKERTAFMLMGGEVFMHKRFFEVADTILKNGHDLEIITNFSFPIDYYERLIAMNTKNANLKFSISLHISQVKIEEFMNKLHLLKEKLNGCKNVYYEVDTVMLPNNFNYLKELAKEFEEKFDIPLYFQNLRLTKNQEHEESFYNQEIEQFMQNTKYKKNGYDVKKQKNIFGTLCLAGCNWVSINPLGDIRRCFEYQPELFELGNIKDGKIEFFDKPLPCLANRCSCPIQEPYWGKKNLWNAFQYLSIKKIKSLYFGCLPLFYSVIKFYYFLKQTYKNKRKKIIKFKRKLFKQNDRGNL